MEQHRDKLAVRATRGMTVRDFLVFQVKLALDGVKDVVAASLSVVAIIIDLIAGQGRRPRLFYSVVRMSQRFEGWLGLHRMQGLAEAGDDDDDVDMLLESDADDLINRFEELVRRELPGGREREPGDGGG